MGIWTSFKSMVGGYKPTDIDEPGVSSEEAVVPASDLQIRKSYTANFLYKPPFGYPRDINVPILKDLTKNAYVFSTIQTISDEISSTDWDIVVKEGYDGEVSEDDITQIRNWFYNPNPENESFKQILKMAIQDILELDAGVWIKVFGYDGKFKSLYARDGSTFLKNPDIYGSIQNRVEYVRPTNLEEFKDLDNPNQLQRYEDLYDKRAAYYQYGWTRGAYPVPFGKREVVYMMRNPRTDSLYGRSPLEVIGTVLYTLIYGSSYNLDFYLNNNMPEGIIKLIGANPDQIKQFRERFDRQFRQKDTFGNTRKVGYKYPIVNRDAGFEPFQLKPIEMEVISQQQWFIKLFWSCFGITPSEMGFTEDSNRATEHGQNVVVKRKVCKPLLQLLEYHINTQIIPEFGIEGIEFKFNEYDLEEDLKKQQLNQMKINMGVITPEMVAEEEGIDVDRLKQEKEEKRQQNMEEMEAKSPQIPDQMKPEDQKQEESKKEAEKKELKSNVKEEDVFEEIESYIKEIGEKVTEVVDLRKKPLNAV